MAIALAPAPSDSAETPIVDAPHPEDVRMLEEMVEWLTGSPGSSEGFRVTQPADLGRAFRERNNSFALFRDFHGEEARLERLEELPFGQSIHQAASRHDLDSLLLAAVVEAESSFDPNALSPVGAVGLAQVMPTTAGSDELTLFDPEFNLNVGAEYLSQLLGRFEGDLELAVAAYNAGPGAVSRFGGVPPYRETRRYVKKVLGLYLDHHRTVWRQADSSLLFELEP